MFTDTYLHQLQFIANNRLCLISLELLVLILCLDACEEPFLEIEGGCYFFNPDLFTQSHDSANEFCQGMGSYLAVVKSGDENRGIIDVLLTPNGKWVIKACLHGAIATAIYLLHLGASLGTLAKTKLGSGMSANTFIFKPMIVSKNYL